MRISFITIAVAVLVLLAVPAAYARTWTAKAGHTIEGEFVKLENETVFIQLPDGKQAKVKLALLSEDDQQFARNEAGKTANPFEIFDPPPADKTGKEIVPANTGQTKEQKKTPLAAAPHEIRDPQLHNELAMTLAVPDGWKVKKAETQWNPLLYRSPASVRFTLTGPADEVTVWFEYKMEFKWDESFLRFKRREQLEKINDDGYMLLPPKKPEDFIMWAMQQGGEISDIKITKTEKPEPIVKQIKKSEPELTKQMRQIGTGSFKKMTFDTACVTFTCSKEGKRYEQTIAVIITYLHFVSPLAAAGMGGANDECVYWTAMPILSMYALEGKLKHYEQEFALITGNSLLNPVWQNKMNYVVQQTIAAVDQKRIQSQIDIQRQIKETADYVRNARQDVFKNRSDAMSRVSQGWTDVITGTDRWKDSSGQIYAAPSGYNYGYRNAGGRMIFTNDSTAPAGYTPMNKTPWAW